MKTFENRPDRKNRTLDATPKVANQASITDILQTYKDRNTIDVTDRKQATGGGFFPTVAQLSQYEVSKTIPLKGYKKKAKDTKDYWTKSIDALRTLYPGKTDEDRGAEFQSIKERLAGRIQIEKVDGKDKYSFKEGEDGILGRAKMEHIREGETSRTGSMATPVKTLFAKKTPNIAWMGGHLIKDVWGGVDNMMNVAVWDNNKAEKKWSERFEDPLEAHFLIDPTVDSANLNISMVKEDEILAQKPICLSGITNLKAESYLQKKTERLRWEINDAVETIPIRAHGDFSLEKGSKTAHEEIHGVVNLDGGDTGYDAAREVVELIFAEQIEKAKISLPKIKKNVIDEMSIDPNKEQQDMQQIMNENRSEKRVAAMLEEYDRLHLAPDQFEQDIEPGRISLEKLSAITASHQPQQVSKSDDF